MLHTKFQVSEPSGSEDKIFKYLLCISMLQTQGLRVIWAWGHHLKKTWVKDH